MRELKIIMALVVLLFAGRWLVRMLIVAKRVEVLVEELNADLPKRLDRYTELTSVKGEGVRVIYNLRLTPGPGWGSAELFEAVKEPFLRRHCSGLEAGPGLASGLRMRWNFHGDRGRRLGSVELNSPRDCDFGE